MEKQNILLTGASGLIGNSILKKLKTFDNINIHSITSKDIDLRDRNKLNSLNTKYDTIVHCAARREGLNSNNNNTISILLDNISIDTNIVTYAKNNNIKNLIYFGSASMYSYFPDIERVSEAQLFKLELEKETKGYAYAKILNTKLCNIIDGDDTFNYKTLVIPNIYGPEHKYEFTYDQYLSTAAFTKVLKATIDKQDNINVWGSSDTKREFVYIDDLTNYIINIITNQELLKSLPSNINLGSENATTVLEYYKYVAEAFNYTGTFIFDNTRPAPLRNILDCTLAKKFGWKTPTTIQQGIEYTKDYLLNVYNKGQIIL